MHPHEIIEVRIDAKKCRNSGRVPDASLHPFVRDVLKGKILATWKMLLEESSFCEPEVVDESACGFLLVGGAGQAKILSNGITLPYIEADQLNPEVSWRRRLILGKM